VSPIVSLSEGGQTNAARGLGASASSGSNENMSFFSGQGEWAGDRGPFVADPAIEVISIHHTE
jgi:hypothetical protein